MTMKIRQRQNKMLLKSQLGMTLVEIAIVLLIFSMIIGGVFAANKKLTDRYFSEDEIIDTQRNGEVALSRMTSILRQAGYGCSKGIVYPPPGYPNGIALEDANVTGSSTLNSLVMFTNDGPSGDVLTIAAAHEYLGTGTLAADDVTITLNPSRLSSTENRPNCEVYVHPTRNPWFVLANVTGPNTVVLNSAFQLRNFDATVSVYRVNAYTFRIVIDDDDGVPYLRVDDNRGQSTAHKDIAEGVERIQFQFGTGGGSSLSWQDTPPLNITTLRAIRAFVLVRSILPDRNYEDNNQYTLGNVTYGPFGDHFHRKVLNTTVMLRDFVYVTI